MKKINRLLSFILTCVMVASSAVFTVNAANNEPEAGYGIEFVYNVASATAVATVSVSGGTYGVGRFGFSYDAEVLDLLAGENVYVEGTDIIADVVIGESVDGEYLIKTTEETNLASDLIDTENGIVLFAWYADGTDYVVAEDEAKVIATVNFALKDGKTTDDLAAAEEIIGAVDNDDIPVDVNGWDEVYSVMDDDMNRIAVENVEVEDNSKLTVNTSGSGTNVTIKFDPLPNEAEAGIDHYKVEVFEEDGVTPVLDEDGNPLVVEVQAGEEDYSVKFTSDDGLEKNEKYKVLITPYSGGGVAGIPEIVEVITKSSSLPVVPGGDIGGGVESSLTYTVTFIAGDGIIPEGQKYKYQVARNGYVSGSPAVIAPEGKIFAGWSVDGVTLISIEVYKITKDTSFKALYVDREDETHRPFIVGYPGGTVKAENTLTRAEAATIIARASGAFDEDKEYSTKYFTDVASDHWAYNYIAFVYENGIVNGYENNTFAPDSKITRAEFATIMQRFLGLELHEEETFVDVAKDNWAVAYIGACKFAGLIEGYENGEFRPNNEITRAEAVKVLNRATDRTPTPNAIDAYVDEKGIPFEDLTEDKWYFYEIMEAAFPHLVSYYH